MPSRQIVALLAWIVIALPRFSAAEQMHFTTTYLPPFMYEENGQVAGVGHEIIAEVCARQQLRCTFELLPWRRAQKMVREGSAQGIFMVGHNPARESWMRFSPPILETGYGFFARKGSDFSFKDIESLNGQCIAVNSPSNMHNRLKAIQAEMVASGLEPFRIETTTSLPHAFRLIAGGRCGLVFGNVDVGAMVIREHNLENLRAAGHLEKQLYYFGLSLDHVSDTLAKRFNEGVQVLLAEGVIARTLARYNMNPPPARL